MSVDGRQILLPIWHKITKDEVVKASPSLADKVALRTADYGVDEIANEVATVIRGGEHGPLLAAHSRASGRTLDVPLPSGSAAPAARVI